MSRVGCSIDTGWNTIGRGRRSVGHSSQNTALSFGDWWLGTGEGVVGEEAVEVLLERIRVTPGRANLNPFSIKKVRVNNTQFWLMINDRWRLELGSLGSEIEVQGRYIIYGTLRQAATCSSTGISS